MSASDYREYLRLKIFVSTEDGKTWRVWTAQIRADGKQHHLGNFKSEEGAARAYDVAAKRLHGEFAWLNFPDSVREVRP